MVERIFDFFFKEILLGFLREVGVEELLLVSPVIGFLGFGLEDIVNLVHAVIRRMSIKVIDLRI